LGGAGRRSDWLRQRQQWDVCRDTNAFSYNKRLPPLNMQRAGEFRMRKKR